mmetsp:Transcript_11099/g.28005  ORF Transcript_11099/g.28005 Transcript_11099/m.28005 type:complete len:131 (+) Transcript_11099:67-459(+)
MYSNIENRRIPGLLKNSQLERDRPFPTLGLRSLVRQRPPPRELLIVVVEIRRGFRGRSVIVVILPDGAHDARAQFVGGGGEGKGKEGRQHAKKKQSRSLAQRPPNPKAVYLLRAKTVADIRAFSHLRGSI